MAEIQNRESELAEFYRCSVEVFYSSAPMCIANSQSFDLWMKHPPHLPRTMVGAERQDGLSSSAGSTPFGHQLSSRPLDRGGWGIPSSSKS